MALVTIDMDLPDDLEIIGYERHDHGHGFEVSWPLPQTSTCDRCHHDEPLHLECKDQVQVVRDLDVWGQPSFWIHQTMYHRCSRCHHRQHLLAPFKRKNVTYTYRFEQHVLTMLVGSNEEEVAARLGISAETVARIVRNQLGELTTIDPARVITHIGLDEISLKKRHKLYVTILTDLSNPDRPEVLAVVRGKDEAAGQTCLGYLSEAQRKQVQTYRVDMGAAYHAAGRKMLPKARAVVDRFHVAKKFNEVVDRERKRITRAYKATLTKDQRKQFRSQMWNFRRRPEDLEPHQREQLEALFVQIPQLRRLYELRNRFTTIFDTAKTGQSADYQLCGLRLDALDAELDLEEFFGTYEDWQQEILNYFPEGYTSAQVEGINNKARVITKRAYGLKNPASLWRRLILDVNQARKLIRRSIDSIRELVSSFRVIFRPFCT